MSIHHRRPNPTLKTSLICLIITIAGFLTLFIGEQVIYQQTFPSSTEEVEIEGVKYHIGVGTQLGQIISIILYADALIIPFPQVNLTHLWLIPDFGGIWSWRRYQEVDLVFDREIHTVLSRVIYTPEIPLNPEQIFDVVVEVNTTGFGLYYLHTLDLAY